MFISKEVRQLGNDIVSEFRDGAQTQYTYHHRYIQIWNGSGVLFIDLYPKSNAFNVFEKFYIKKCIKKATILKSISN